jgi:hypothetical protein
VTLVTSFEPVYNGKLVPNVINLLLFKLQLNLTAYINTLCGHGAEILFLKSGGTYSYHCALKG